MGVSLGLVSLVLIYPFGYEVNGQGAGSEFRPVPVSALELMKLCLPIALAWYLHERSLPPKPRHVLVSLILLAIPVA